MTDKPMTAAEAVRNLQTMCAACQMDPRNRQAVEDAANTIERMARSFSTLRESVNQQAEDHGLWFEARTAPERFLQQELRALHALIEKEVREVLGDE